MSKRSADRIRRDLEDRGVPASVSQTLAAHLAPQADQLGGQSYESLLTGAVLTFVVHRDGEPELRRTARDLGEIQQLMSDFHDELRKLDEALETLAAYVVRLRTQSDLKDRTLH